jgi:large subunit ribosomal protein L43
MATRGVFQLTKLHIRYCEHGGSSRTLRSYIANGNLTQWATDHPHVEIHVIKRNGQHPFVEADYLTNNKKLSYHQISLKNYESYRDIQDTLELLRNRSGRKITKITKDVLTDTPSIQGIWTPFLNLHLQEETMPSFKVTMFDNNKIEKIEEGNEKANVAE